MWYAMLHFSAGFIWWAAQAEIHSSWYELPKECVDLSLKRGQRGQVRARAGCVCGVQRGGLSLSADTVTLGFQSSAFKQGKAGRRFLLDKHHGDEQSFQTGDVKLCNRRGWFLNASSTVTEQNHHGCSGLQATTVHHVWGQITKRVKQ